MIENIESIHPGDIYTDVTDDNEYMCVTVERECGSTRIQSERYNKNMSTEMQINRLKHALQDWHNWYIAYPILAMHGYMERTPNGFKQIDADAIINRINELIHKLETNAI